MKVLSLFILFTLLSTSKCQKEFNKEFEKYSEAPSKINNTVINYVPLRDANEPENSCKRACITGDHRKCHYKFTVEWYHTMSKACYDCPQTKEDCYREDCVMANGVPRSIVVVNRQLPGPTIEVCLGDEVVVEVENGLMGETTSIHWHGQHQIGTPYMDGVPQLTQCPIGPDTTFVYSFNATNAGTHFWHSHTGIQRGDGTFGPFIVRVPKKTDPFQDYYDFDEHIMSVVEWDDTETTDFYSSFIQTGTTFSPSSILVNGLGIRDFSDTKGNTPIARFVVKRGKKYKFRFINAGFFDCPIEMSIDNHKMMVINSDGNDFMPVYVDSMVSYAAERFDFIVEPISDDNDFHWIRMRGHVDCAEYFTKVHQVAILQYVSDDNETLPDGNFPTYETSTREGVQLNPLNQGEESLIGKDDQIIPISKLEAIRYEDDEEWLKDDPDHKFFIGYDFYEKDHPLYHKKGKYGYNQVPITKRVQTPQLNHISFRLQSVPILPAKDSINDAAFCNETTLSTINKNCKEEACLCTHVLQVKLNSIVELILVDEGVIFDANHPFHLHGHSFRVLGMERLGSTTSVDEVRKLDERKKLKRNFNKSPLKDTVTVPDGGYTIVKFKASNPGYWLFHCHVDFHVELGMALIFKVGENSDMPDAPNGFPICGDYGAHGNGQLEKPNAAILIFSAAFVILIRNSVN